MSRLPASTTSIRPIAIGLMVFGAIAASGLLPWLLDQPASQLTRRHAGLGYFLAGVALYCVALEKDRACKLASLVAWLFVIDMVRMLARSWGGFPISDWPGPIAVRGSLTFALLGVFLLTIRCAPKWAALAAFAGMVVIEWLNLLAFLLGWRLSPFELDDQHGPAVTSVIAWLLILVAIYQVGNSGGGWQTYFRHRRDRTLVALGTMVALLVSLAIGIGSVSLSNDAAMQIYDQALLARANEDANRIREAVKVARERIGTRLQKFELPARAESCPALLARLAAQFRTVEPVQVSVVRGDGRRCQEGGAEFDKLPVVPVGDDAALLWDTPPLIAVSQTVSGSRGERLTLSIVTKVEDWLPGAFLASAFGNTGETLFGLLHDGQLHFQPTRYVDRPFVTDPQRRGVSIPLMRGASGESGVVVAPDYRDVKVKAAFIPVLPGVGVVQKVDLSELVTPMARWMWLETLAITLMSALGAWVLYRALYPLASSLQRQETRHRAILDRSPVALITAKADGMLLNLNRRAEALFGLATSAVRGQSITSLFDDPLLGVALREMTPGSELQVGYPALRGDGSLFPAEAHLRLEGDGEAYLLATVVDRSKEIERQSQLAVWESVFMNASWGIALGAADEQTLQDLNPAFARMHGFSRDELIGKPLVDVFAPAQRAEVAGHIAAAHRQGQYSFESVHLRKDGAEFPVRISITVVYGAQHEVRLRIVNVEDLTERRAMERQLADAEQMSRLVLDTQKDMVVRYQPDSTILYGNRAYSELFNRDSETIVGLRWTEMIREAKPGQATELQSMARDMAKHPRRMEMVSAHMHPRYGFLWIHWTIMPIYSEGRKLLAFQASGHDITARKAAEDALLERESWFRAIFDSSLHLALVVDKADGIVAINRKMLTFLSKTRQDQVGIKLHEVLSRHCSAQSVVLMEQAVTAAFGKDEGRLTILVKSGIGEERAMEFAFRPIVGSDSLINHVIVEGHDITEYMAKEKQISEREARFQGVTESVPGAVFEFTRRDNQIQATFFNEGAAELFGLANHYLQPSSIDFLRCLLTDDRASFITQVTACEHDQRELQWTGRLARPEGGWVSLSATQRKLNGEIVWSGVGIEITTIKEAELEVEQSQLALRELSAHYEMVREDERRLMAREVHDELGQNLTALRMGLSVLGEQARVSAISGEAKRLKAIVDKSITVVRGIATTLRPAALDLGIASALNWLANEFQANTRIECTVSVNLSGAQLSDDKATALFRIAQESLTNVARHANPNRVWLLMHRVNNYVVLEVGDDGKGFDAKGRAGAGFGLLGMRERALNLGGDMEIQSSPGEGTVISIQIPLE